MAVAAAGVSQLAAALKAEKLILMTDVPGVLKDKDDIATKYTELDIRSTRQLVSSLPSPPSCSGSHYEVQHEERGTRLGPGGLTVSAAPEASAVAPANI